MNIARPTPENQDAIKRLIKDCLAKKGWSYKDLAERTGYAEGTINNKLNKSVSINMPMLRKICEALDYPLTDVLDGIEYTPPESIAALKTEVGILKERVCLLEGIALKLASMLGREDIEKMVKEAFQNVEHPEGAA